MMNEEERIGHIYIIKNKINNKIYIGQTVKTLQCRFKQHVNAAKENKRNYVIYLAMRKHGIENFYIELIEDCKRCELNNRETYWISKYNSTNPKYGYNMSKGGNKVSLPTPITEEEVLQLFKQNVSAYIIAKTLHTSVWRITEILKKHNIQYGIDLQRTDKNIELQIIDLYKMGYSCVKIANYFNLNKSTVLHILIRNNISRRSVNETKILERNLPTLEKVLHESSATCV